MLLVERAVVAACAYYPFRMPNVLHWTLVFTAASLEHLAERDIDAEDVADAVFGQYGVAACGEEDGASTRGSSLSRPWRAERC